MRVHQNLTINFKVKNQYRNWLQLFIIVLLLSLKNTINAQDLIRTNINDSIKHSIIFNQNTLKPFGNGGLNYYEKDKLLAYDTSFSNNIDKYFSTHQYVKFNWTIHHKYVNLVFLPQYLIIYFSADHPHNKTLVYIEKVNLKIFEKIHTSAIQGKLTDTHFSGGTYNSLSYGFSPSLKLHDSISNPSDSILQQLIFENFKELNSILHKNISLKIQKPKVEDIQVNSSICLGMPEIFQLSNLPLSATIPLKKEKKKSIKNNPK